MPQSPPKTEFSSLSTYFRNNTLITKFGELNKFSNVTILTGSTSNANSSTFTGTNLSKIGLEKIVSLTNGYALANLSKLKSAYLPKLSTLSARYGMQYCTSLEKIEIGDKLTAISFGVWRNCSSLTVAIFHSTTPPTASTNNFQSTPIASGNGYIYVPDESVDDYKAASNWSTYAGKIKGLSEYTGEILFTE